MPRPASDDDRVLVAAPLGRDGELAVRVLQEAGFQADHCPGAEALARCIADGAGAALVAEELLDPAGLEALVRVLGDQPAWSDFPLMVFTPTRTSMRADAEVMARVTPLGNVSLLERPIRIATLLSAIGSALRSRRRQYEVRDLVLQLEDGVRQRDRFLAMLGHELRNPLGAIVTAADVMQLRAQAKGEDGDPTAPQREVVRRQARTLTRLVDDLLEVARVTSGKVRLSFARVDIREAVAHAVETMRPIAERGGVTLRDATAADPALEVWGDSTRLEQVFHNLLHNAIKFTPAGGEVEVAAARVDDAIEIAVRDTGAGMDAETLPRIFDLFRQAPRTLDRAEGGLGLGLTLVRSVVELHGGAVTADSGGLGRGSAFVVRLRAFDPIGQATAEHAPEAAARRPLAGRRVVVVEDHADNREGLVELLRWLGADVDAAANGDDGAERIVAGRPDLALVDLGLPGIDGFEVARRVRIAAGPAVLLVALTGYGQDEDRARARDAGFDAHLTKPVDAPRLQQVLTTLLSATTAS